MEVRAKGVEDLNKIADALREASDKELTNNVRAEFRKVAKPMGEKVIAEGAEKMPHRGGLAARVASQGRVGLSTALVAKTTRITLLLNNKGVSMRNLDAGVLRHKVFDRPGRMTTWVKQSVPAGAFSKAFAKQEDAARAAALAAANKTLDGVARKV